LKNIDSHTHIQWLQKATCMVNCHYNIPLTLTHSNNVLHFQWLPTSNIYGSYQLPEHPHPMSSWQ
jgi:hypothetical protein